MKNKLFENMLNANLKSLNFRFCLIFYLSFILSVVFLSVYFTNSLITKYPGLVDKDYNIILKQIPFAHGQLIHNLFYENSYYLNDWNITMYAARLPFVPYLISSIFSLFQNIYYFLVLKNIIFFSIYFLGSYIFVSTLNLKIWHFLSFLCLILYNPYNLIVSLNFVYADFVVALLLPSFYLIIISEFKHKFILSAIILFVLYLTKVNMFFLTIFLSLFIFFIENKKYKIFPIIFVFSAVLIWGGFSFNKTQRFAFGSGLISINSWGLSHVLNKDFKNYYPDKTVDRIVNEKTLKKINFNDEWEFYDFYQKQNYQYIKSNYKEFLSNILLKAKFIFTYIYVDGSQVFITDNKKEIRYSNIPNKLILNISILLLFLKIFRKRKTLNIEKYDFYYLLILLFYLAPLLVGWATSKHLIGIFLVSKIYTFITLAKLKKE